MEKIQIAFFFITGFFISRLIIKSKLPEIFVNNLISNSKVSISKITLYFISSSALLSLFIPNVIAVLTMLPVIKTIIKAYEEKSGKGAILPTLFTLAVMYGANIGGMGSVTATPANGILVSFAALNGVAESEKISFASWLLWGVPLVVTFSMAAWGVLVFVFRTNRLSELHGHLDLDFNGTYTPLVKVTLILTAIYFISSVGFSIWMLNAEGEVFNILIASGIFTLIFNLFLFVVPLKIGNLTSSKVLLKISDCYSDLPIRGFLFVGISIGVAGILYLFNLQGPFANFIKDFIPMGTAPLLILFLLALLTSFSTELLSNTAIQISLFVILLPLSTLIGVSTIESLVVITLSSTCAFMSPIATGVNGLAFGGIKNVSLKMMLFSGFFINLIGAAIISGWIYFVL